MKKKNQIVGQWQNQSFPLPFVPICAPTLFALSVYVEVTSAEHVSFLIDPFTQAAITLEESEE